MEIPGGTWHNSARNERLEGNILHAELQNEHGQWEHSEVEIHGGETFGNNNGHFEEEHHWSLWNSSEVNICLI